MPSSEPSLFQSGIPSFDALLGGGIPSRQAVIVTGTPGCGKTVLCSQVAFDAASRGIPVVMATVTSEPHDKLMSSLSSFSFFKPELLGEKLFVISAYSALKRGPKEARDLLLQTVREHKAGVLFIDGLRSIRDLWSDEARLREFLYELGIGLSAVNCIGLFTTEYPLDRLMGLPEATTVDGIVALSIQPQGARRLRRVEVVKLRGREHLTGEHVMTINQGGVEFIPRLESTPLDFHDEPPTLARKGFGLPELDTLMFEGLPELSTTMLAGSMGIGKTLLATHFVADGARRGEQGLFVSFFDSPAMLMARAKRVGLDVAALHRDGLLSFQHVPPMELEADLFVRDVLRKVEALGVKRLVIDGLSELEQSILDPSRRRTFLASLAMRLRILGVTSIFTREVPKVVGTELDFSDAPVAILGENLLLLRYVELHGRMHRILSVLKMRDSKYASDLREFQINDTGVKVLAPLRSAAGLLTGQAQPIGSTVGGAKE
ncbi:AAA family ATPase [Corallococcus praedator]|uniref:non-specific serine/threonine protein kinase n=1 Tax=Corallococcus praedator TaxID=2316724 RepID=A0ABX9QLM9_9BACT|nr:MULTISPECIES: ATPase domain-containing protein [Corallococcus]RKH31904.1 AAA family ATPase [Corallococcus sp. CA031C]RKI10323.1 AAA family ATPase [Corallococcus praedator]